jgi:alpha-1,2-mannosyltransferase
MWQYLEIAIDGLRSARWLTRKRLLRWGSFCAFLTIGVLALDLAAHSMAGLTNANGEPVGRDFMGFWSNAQLAAAGRPEAAYIVGPHRPVDQAMPYPPVVLLLCWPLASLSYPYALLVWGGVGLALCTWSLSRLVGWEMAVFAVIGTPAGFINIFIEQNGYYTAALLACGLMLVERRPVPAGILFGMLCYKPQFGILLPLALAAGGHWRVIIAAAATALVLIAASAILLGPETWVGFFDRLPLQREFMETRAAAWSWMSSTYAMMRLLGEGSPTAYVIQGLATISATVAVAALWRGQSPHGIKCAGLVVGTFVATPYAWGYDMVVLVFAAAWLANDAVQGGFQPWEKITVFVLSTLPALALVPAKLFDFQIAPILLWLTMAVILRRGPAWPRRSFLETSSVATPRDRQFPA